MWADFLNVGANIALFFLLVRFAQIYFPNGDFAKAISFLFH